MGYLNKASMNKKNQILIKNIIIFLVLVLVVISCSYQDRQKTKDRQFKLNNNDVAVVIPELHSMSELKELFQEAKIGYKPEIINQTEYVERYYGTLKIAANLGVYLADFLFAITTNDSLDIDNDYGAIFQLATKYGISASLYELCLKRQKEEGIALDDLFYELEQVLEKSRSEMDESDVSEFSSYLIFGNYIEKLYLVSALVREEGLMEDPAIEKETKLKMLRLLSNQSVRINQLLYILSKYPDASENVVVLEDLELLFSCYLDVEANRDSLLKLEPDEICKSAKITSIFEQIDKIRSRVVLL